jgi:hypothetical protein
MIFLLVVLVVVGVPLAVLRFGADSRDGRDWKPLCGFDSDYTSAVQHGATNQNSVLVHSGGRVSQG